MPRAKKPRAKIHRSAVVDRTAKLGPGTVVWSHVCIGARAVLGADCRVGHAAYIDREVRVGDRVWIHGQASLYRPLVVGNDVFIGPHAVFVNDPDPTPHRTRDLAGKRWQVGDGATVGAQATILSDVNLAPHTFVGAGAVVTHDTVAFGIYAGVPARLVGYRCSCGARFTPARGLPNECPTCQRRF